MEGLDLEYSEPHIETWRQTMDLRWYHENGYPAVLQQKWVGVDGEGRHHESWRSVETININYVD